jgi:hypothetical protein
MLGPDEPSIENTQLKHSTPVICTGCGTGVRLCLTDNQEGVNIACDCHQIDTLPYYTTVEDLIKKWKLRGPDSSPDSEKNER